MKRAAAILLASLAAVLRGADAPAPLSPYWITNTVLRATTNLSAAAAADLLETPLPAPRGASLQAYLGRDVRAAAPTPAPTSGVDCCFLPLGHHELGGDPVAGSGVRTASRLLVCEPDVVRAVAWRLRRDLEAGARVPVLVDHAGAEAGRVVAAWYDPARGAMARLALLPSGEAALASGRRAVSPSMLELYASTPAVTNGVAFPSDAYVLPWRALELSLVRAGRLPGAGTTTRAFRLSAAPAITPNKETHR